jgi:hypothetical protein
MGKKKIYKKDIKNNVERWTEEQYEEYLKGLYGMEFIAGFTENGVPYGIFEEEESDIIGDFDELEEMPF